MTTTSEPEGAALPRTNPRYWKNISAEDIPPGWIDDMVKRLFEELNGQLIRIERASAQRTDVKDSRGRYEDDAKRAEQDAHTLSSLQRSLERLIDMDMERLTLRSTKKTRTRTETRESLAKQLAETPGPGAPSRLPGKDH
jgi:hypothetical protein